MILRGVAALLIGVATLAGGVGAGAGQDAAARKPAGLSADAAMAALGRRLFYDGDLSIDGSMACSTCHGQRHGFAEGNRSHPGVTDEPGRRNVQGLANVGRRRSLTWGDATIRTLEAQALVPLLGENPVEMAMKGQEAELARRLSGNACYTRLFAVAFPETGGRIDLAGVTRALGAFQRGLVSDAAPADRFVRGDQGAISMEARAGAALFGQHCAACHAGPDYTDDHFHRIGAPDPRDRGLGDVTGRADDDGRFRTPSLRNVAVSAPYFHDGASATLGDAIRRHGMTFAAPEEATLVAWLATMTDQAFITNPRFAYPDGPCEVG
ncbi:MAG TPA: cytochrome c peroxidase [Sphingobium sp.]|nr:cytochrome c peroxidase [Sphingobium sp.]